METLEGGCSCDAIRYRLERRPLFVHCCHCSWCQRETGSAFAVNALIEAEAVTLLQGSPLVQVLPSASGKGQRFWRCGDCGVTLWSNYYGSGEKIHFVRVGTLERPEAAPPDIHVYTTTKLPWVRLPEGLPAVPEYYQLSDHWPAESLARYEAARSG